MGLSHLRLGALRSVELPESLLWGMTLHESTSARQTKACPMAYEPSSRNRRGGRVVRCHLGAIFTDLLIPMGDS